MHVQSLKQFVTTTINCKIPREGFHTLSICRFAAFYRKTALFPQKDRVGGPLLPTFIGFQEKKKRW